ncbi:Protein MON2-like [Papilio xuthus]|uniref:Protein MON2-like n=1 Tax=Papilio xuthus TaxID=66420 RepID=A0A0N1PFB9_PAPXU|nr:Protein MON2-like [Papilio xuthus]
MTTSDLVHGDTLARTMVMCMRTVSASEARDVSTSHAAAATVRQLVALVFERALAEADASSGLPQQAGFYWKGVWLPLCVTFEPGTAKSV